MDSELTIGAIPVGVWSRLLHFKNNLLTMHWLTFLLYLNIHLQIQLWFTFRQDLSKSTQFCLFCCLLCMMSDSHNSLGHWVGTWLTPGGWCLWRCSLDAPKNLRPILWTRKRKKLFCPSYRWIQEHNQKTGKWSTFSCTDDFGRLTFFMIFDVVFPGDEGCH